MKLQILILFLCGMLIHAENEVKFVENNDDLLRKVFNLYNSKDQEGNFFNATVNEFADQIMTNFDAFLLKTGYDPLPVPDIEAEIVHRVLLIKYTGKLYISQISLKDFSTAKRGADAIVTYDKNTKKLQMTIPMRFEQIEFDSHYKLKIMGISNSGRITGQMKPMELTTTIEFDFNTFNASVSNFEITKSGHIKVDLHKIFLVNWAVDLVANTVTVLFKGTILDDASGVIQGCFQQVADIINAIVHDVAHLFEQMANQTDKITSENVLENYKQIVPKTIN